MLSYHDLQLMIKITNCGLNGYVCILGIILVILDKLIYDSQNVWVCLTLHKMLIKLASLIICSGNDNLTNTSSTPPPDVKKTVLYIVRYVILCTSTETSICWKFTDKIFNLFLKHQINVTVVLLCCGIFFKY